ncbi:unnamed protein product [Cuscuta europaea]|uniref:Uncharacterized protein n=1 Tax=Cuscuta europaea TaxID=41803 RepID=A0A9P1EMR5_CUSEU|nr:unnamed protein product [Cuscuta europaea]
MKALVLVQARIISQSGQSHFHTSRYPIRQAEKRWCNRRGTLEELNSMLQMKQDGVFRRERAMSYAISQVQPRTRVSSYSRTNKRVTLNMDDHNKGQGSNWLVIEDGETPVSRGSGPTRSFSQPLDHNQSVKIKRNYISSTRVLGKESRLQNILLMIEQQPQTHHPSQPPKLCE